MTEELNVEVWAFGSRVKKFAPNERFRFGYLSFRRETFSIL